MRSGRCEVRQVRQVERQTVEEGDVERPGRQAETKGDRTSRILTPHMDLRRRGDTVWTSMACKAFQTDIGWTLDSGQWRGVRQREARKKAKLLGRHND